MSLMSSNLQVKSGMEGKPGQNVQKMLNSSSCTLVFASMCSARWVYSISRRWWANVPHLCCCKCPSATGMTNVQREVLSVYWTYFVCRSTCTNTHFCFNKTECQKIVEEHSAVAGALPNGEKCWQSMLVCTVVSLGESLKLPDSFNEPCFSLGIKVANKVLQYF